MTIAFATKVKPGWENFPFGLLLLSVIYLLVFFTVQLEDDKYKNEAVKFYFQSELDKTEFPLYVKFVRKHIREDLYFRTLENITNGKITKLELYWMQRQDPFFQACLSSDKCLSPSTLAYLNWQEKRRAYLNLADKETFQQYGFKTATPSLLSAITNLFVQPNIFQLLINLLFLIAIGSIVESKTGIFRFFLSYCLCGISMVSIYCLLAPYSLIPLSGASGGVAGLLAMMLVFTKGKSIKFYIFNFRHITSFEASSVYVLILWLVSQFIILRFTSFDTVMLISQGFAFLTGLLLAILINKMLFINHETKTTTVQKTTDIQARLAEAISEISLLNYSSAKNILYQLLDEYPTNKEIHFQLFNIVKTNPGSEEYHDIVQKIFSIKDSSRSTVAMINLVFKNYLRRAQPTIRFDIEIFIGLLQRFRKAGYYDDAEKILKVLIKHNNEDQLSEVLAREQLLLARSYLMKNDKVQGDRLLVWLIETFPHTESAKQAKSFVNVKSTRTL
ncbi:MAG: rhomboid family intramembrane serine protease [Gammaproteobacteria bacterium]|jgi:membrane associated rhomboid family serine protease|nr:rhomboid family intramembrane serine protease [Gammaproteobacteria bacterium]